MEFHMPKPGFQEPGYLIECLSSKFMVAKNLDLSKGSYLNLTIIVGKQPLVF